MSALVVENANITIPKRKNPMQPLPSYKTPLCFVTTFRTETTVQEEPTVDLFIVEKKKKKSSKDRGFCHLISAIRLLPRAWHLIYPPFMVQDPYAKTF